MLRLLQAVVTTTVIAGPVLAGAASAEEIKLPSTLAMTAYGTSSTGYAQMVGIGGVLQNKYETSVRILPGENDVSRMTPLKTGRVDLCACGIAAYFASEGVLLFADKDWGPQQVRVIATSIGNSGLGTLVAGDLGVETPYDLKGKRIAYIRGDAANNLGAEAYLAFGDLTWDDVERVTFPGYGRTFDGIISGQADAAFTSTPSAHAQKVAASPRGITWPTLDPQNTEGWKRLQSVAPYFQPHTVDTGAGISTDNSWQGATYPYPILLVNEDYSDDTARNLIRFFVEDHEEYKDTAPGAEGFGLESQNMLWVIPLHDAVVDYYREIGHWTDEMQAHQDMLIQRQDILQETWTDYMDSSPPDGEEEFRAGWLQARANALEAAGMNPVFR